MSNPINFLVAIAVFVFYKNKYQKKQNKKLKSLTILKNNNK